MASSCYKRQRLFLYNLKLNYKNWVNAFFWCQMNGLWVLSSRLGQYIAWWSTTPEYQIKGHCNHLSFMLYLKALVFNLFKLTNKTEVFFQFQFSLKIERSCTYLFFWRIVDLYNIVLVSGIFTFKTVNLSFRVMSL